MMKLLGFAEVWLGKRALVVALEAIYA